MYTIPAEYVQGLIIGISLLSIRVLRKVLSLKYIDFFDYLDLPIKCYFCDRLSFEGDPQTIYQVHFLRLRSERSGVRYLPPPCFVLKQRHIYSPKVLLIPRKRWLRPYMTEKVLTGTLSINKNKQTNKRHDKFRITSLFSK